MSFLIVIEYIYPFLVSISSNSNVHTDMQTHVQTSTWTHIGKQTHTTTNAQYKIKWNKALNKEEMYIFLPNVIKSVTICLKATKLMQQQQKKQTKKQTNKKTQDNNKNHPGKHLH